jgi:hypothetical protein
MTRAAKTEQKSLVPAQQAHGINHGRTSFPMHSFSPHPSQFQQSTGATPLQSLCPKPQNVVIE